jgi:hypothetical protein
MVAVMLASGPLAGAAKSPAPIAVGPLLLGGMAPEKAIVPTIISVVIGAAFGFVSEKLANALTKKAPAAAE